MRLSSRNKILILIMFLLISGYFLFHNYIFNKGTYSYPDVYTTEQLRQAVVETARAYYNKGTSVQYDGYRRQLYSAPEEATYQDPIYTVCSNYVDQVYYNVFGIELPEFTDYSAINHSLKKYAESIYENNPDSEYIVYYNENEEEILDGLENGNDFFNDIYNRLLPGDIVNIRRDKDNGSENGHAMLVESIDYENGLVNIIHSTGGTYDANTSTDSIENTSLGEGSIRKMAKGRTIEGLLNYLKSQEKETQKISSISVIRIITDSMEYPDPTDINRMLPLNITDSAKTRLKYPSIDISKIYSAESQSNHENRIVELNDIIKYTITIENNSDETYDDLLVTETIPNYVTFVDNSQTMSINNINFSKNNETLTWTISGLSSGETATITYQVKVDYNTNNIGKNIVSEGYVGNIKNTPITNIIGINLTEQQENDLLTAYNALKQENSTYRELTFIKEMYQRAGLNNLVNKIETLYDEENMELNANIMVRINQTKCPNINVWQNKYCNYAIDNNAKKMLLSNYFGIRIGSASDIQNNVMYTYRAWDWKSSDNANRARTIKIGELTVGDIIMSYNLDDGVNVVKDHVFIGNNRMAISSSVSNSIYNWKESATSRILNNLIGDTYIILRPSLAYDYYTISFDANGGIGNMDNMLVTMDEEIILPQNNYQKENYYFKEWNTSADGTGTSYSDKQELTALTSTNNDEIKLYAIWEPNVHVSLNNSAATSPGTTDVWYQYNTWKKIGNIEKCYYYLDSSFTTCIDSTGYTIVKPTKCGYNFNGYYTEKNGSGTRYINNNGVFVGKLYANVNHDITLYANWTKAGDYLKGDLNKNNKIDLSDIIILLKKYLGIDSLSEDDIAIADTNCDGHVNLIDIIILLKTYLFGNE